MTKAFFFDPLSPFCADLIVIDPPWEFALYSAKGQEKSAQKHYACIPSSGIKSLPVGELAGRDCWLFLWATMPMLDVGMDCLKAWGFRYVSALVWRKTTNAGKTAMGPGYIVRGMAEVVLIGCFGKPHFARALEGLFDGVRREHSRKPDEFYHRIESFAPHARKVDVFGRQSRPGWRVWGNEAAKFDAVGDAT